MSGDNIYVNIMPKDTSKNTTTGVDVSEKVSNKDQTKGNAQSSEQANCGQLTVDEMGLLRLKLKILAILSVILGAFLVAFQVSYFLRLNCAETESLLIGQKNRNDNLTKTNTNLKTELEGVKEQLDILREQHASVTLALVTNMSDITQKLEILQEQYDNATAMKRTLEANLTETESLLIEEKNRTDNLTKENTNLKSDLQVLQVEAQRKCADNWEYFSRSCYYFSSDLKNWTDSRDACVAMGGHLAIIKSHQEMDFLVQKRTGKHHWIGLSWTETKRWFWLDSTPFNQPTFWEYQQPSNPGVENCAEILETKLNDAPCGFSFMRICESKSCRT